MLLSCFGISEFKKLLGSDNKIPNRRVPRDSRAGLPAFVWGTSESTSLFVRFFPVIGTQRLAHDSPRRLVYLHVLGEHITKMALDSTDEVVLPGDELSNDGNSSAGSTMPQVQIVETLFPSLRHAMLAYAGPERSSARRRFTGSLYIQEGLLGKAEPVDRALLSHAQFIQLAMALGNFLGRLHGRTLGMRRFLERRVSDRSFSVSPTGAFEPLTTLLTEHMDQIRLFMPTVYRKWLHNGAGHSRNITRLIERFGNGQRRTGILEQVGHLMRPDGIAIRDVWHELCRESERFHEFYGAIGRMGYAKPNYFVQSEEMPDGPGSAKAVLRIKQIFFARHFGVAMLDPAVDAGNTLAELLTLRVRSAMRSYAKGEAADSDGAVPHMMHDESLPEIRRTFCSSYRNSLKTSTDCSPLLAIQSHACLSTDEIVAGLMVRKSRMAAITFLAQHQALRQDSIGYENEQKVVHMCADLLHAGAPSGLRFRDEAHDPLA
jgi:hypothetical protein